jgi:hypothetical protein
MGEIKNAYNILVGKSEGRYRSGDSSVNGIDLKESGREGMNSI